MTERILVVEDDIELARMICDFLSDEGFLVEHIADGAEAIDCINSTPPDLVVLDMMLPGADGLEVVQQVRDQFGGVILMLTARGDDLTEINSLNRGADAFLDKPVRPHILLAHIRANLRRQREPVVVEEGLIDVHDLRVDTRRREAFINGESMTITSMEFDLLQYFCERLGEVVTRDDLYQAFRRTEYDGFDRSMDMRISTLRKKMDDDAPPYRYIKTVRGKGYLLAR